MSNELKPCPFCGGIAEYEAVNKKWLVECQVCVISTSVPMHGKKAAAVYWNRRDLPEGYHIVAIDHEQEQRKRNYEASLDAEMSAYLNDAEGLKNLMEQRMRDNLERHNETVRANSNDADYLQTR